MRPKKAAKSSSPMKQILIAVIIMIVIIAYLVFSGTIRLTPLPPACASTSVQLAKGSYPPVLTWADQFAADSGVSLRPEKAYLVDIVTKENLKLITDRVIQDGRFLFLNPTNRKQFKVFDPLEDLNSTKFYEFKMAYVQYLSSLATQGDRLEAISWKGTDLGFVSLGLWSTNGTYKYDSAMHWNILQQPTIPRYEKSRSVKATWPFLVGVYAYGLGWVAYNFTMFATASGNGTHIVTKDALWLSDSYDGPFDLAEKSIASSTETSNSNIQAAHFAVKVGLIWRFGFNQAFNAFWARTYSRQGYLNLYADDSCDWGPKFASLPVQIFLVPEFCARSEGTKAMCLSRLIVR